MPLKRMESIDPTVSVGDDMFRGIADERSFQLNAQSSVVKGATGLVSDGRGPDLIDALLTVALNRCFRPIKATVYGRRPATIGRTIKA